MDDQIKEDKVKGAYMGFYSENLRGRSLLEDLDPDLDGKAIK